MTAVLAAVPHHFKNRKKQNRMFTLIYSNGQFNRPETLPSFLQSNVGMSPLLQVDCITPYKGTKQDLINDVCEHLNKIDSQIEVTYNISCELESTSQNEDCEINYLVFQIQVNQR